MKAKFCRGLSVFLLWEYTTYRFYTIDRSERDRSTGKRPTSKLALIPLEMW